MFLCQTSTHLLYGRDRPEIALAQLALALEAEYCFVTPKHFLVYGSDNLHLTNISSKLLGAYYGIAIKRALFDGVKIKPLVPEASEINGTTVLLHFPSAVGSLVLDTTTCPNPGNYGFTAVDPNGGAITINSVGLVGQRTIALRTSGAVPGSNIRAGWIGDGARGICNLRDKQGDKIVFDPTGINKRMDRWASILEMTV
ncbi:hypothetical protein ABZT49_31800 [Methylobacterium sp. EM32]|uniref:hypothetical protein n=1 Tax=Methylobacterium sp. EM32 TaxID=3163481 RepID=UPI0033A878CB